MSRLNKNPIPFPETVKVSFADGVISVSGPKGDLKRNIRDEVGIVIKDNSVKVDQLSSSRLTKKLIGTYASHVKNMITGVTEGYFKELKVEGVGYKADMNGKDLQLKVGFSHLVDVNVPKELTVSVKNNLIRIEGWDKELVGSFTASVRMVKKPEPYKGKGIRYVDEVVRRKQGKKSV